MTVFEDEKKEEAPPLSARSRPHAREAAERWWRQEGSAAPDAARSPEEAIGAVEGVEMVSMGFEKSRHAGCVAPRPFRWFKAAVFAKRSREKMSCEMDF